MITNFFWIDGIKMIQSIISNFDILGVKFVLTQYLVFFKIIIKERVQLWIYFALQL
jgi:hypothetical protein